MENSKPKIKPIIKSGIYTAALLILFEIIQSITVVISMVFSTIYAIYMAFKGNDYYLKHPITDFIMGKDTIMLASLLSTLATCLVFGIWWINYNKDRRNLKNRFNDGVKALKSKLFVFVCAGFFSYGAAEIVFVLMTYFLPKQVEAYEKLAQNFVTDNVVIDILVLVFLGPIGEECLFRGLILERFKGCMNVWAAIAVQAILFGIFHGNIVQALYVIIMGLICGYIAVRFNSVIPSIMVHMILNGFSLLLNHLPKSLAESPQFETMLIMMPFVFGYVLFTLLPRDEYGQIDLKL